MTSQKDFIKIELKAKLFDLRKNYFIDNKQVIKALKEIIQDIEVKERLESRLDKQANNAFNGIAGEFRSS